MRFRSRLVRSFGALLLALIVCAALALSACAGGTSASGSGNGTGSANGGSSQPSQQAKQILEQARTANLQNAQVTVQQKVTTRQGSLTANSSGPVALQPYAFDWTTRTQGPGIALETQEILVNNTLYVKQAGASTWRALPLDQVQQYTGISGGAAQALTASPAQWLNVPNPTLVGTEQVNGQPAYHLRGTVTKSGQTQGATGTSASNGQAQGAGTGAFTEDLWISKQTHQPLKIVLHGTATANASGANGSTATSQSQQVTVDQTMVFSQWNQGVSITPPPASAVAGG